MPYDPTARSDRLPAYPYNDLYPAARPSGGGIPKPPGVDLDVLYIGRDPMYHRYEVWYTPDMKPYLQPGSESDKRWPERGEIVGFTAHFANKGTVPSGRFTLMWFIDGAEVMGGTHSGLAPGEQATAVYPWAWAHDTDGDRLLGSHTVRFTVDPGNTIAETYESNNSLEDRTDALSLVLAVTPNCTRRWRPPSIPSGPSRRGLAAETDGRAERAFARSIYPSTPDGITERVRLGKIVVASAEPPAEPGADGGFYMSGDDRAGNPYYHPGTDVSGALLHEVSHQLGVIDLYNLGAELLSHQLVDRNGQPVQLETGLSYRGLMLDPGIDPPIFEEHSTLGLNTNKGFRRGYYGEYLFNLPEVVRLACSTTPARRRPGWMSGYTRPAPAGSCIRPSPTMCRRSPGRRTPRACSCCPTGRSAAPSPRAHAICFRRQPLRDRGYHRRAGRVHRRAGPPRPTRNMHGWRSPG